MDIKSTLMYNYLPYAKSTIIDRALPFIDGLKPSHRKILYTMYTMGLLSGAKTKSSNIVGQTMKIHPHGDSSIYDTMVRMSTGHDALNAPYVESKGNFGKVYSDDLAYAAPRYTEAKLTPLCKEIFEGINENAVDMVDNFDNTTVEPKLLPVKFPTILVNATNGIAVGVGSSIPSFSLVNVCTAVSDILHGKITNVEQLMDVLGVPEFTTGGYVHASKEDLIKLGETGKGSFVVSGTVNLYSDKIIITEIPYKVKTEQILSAIEVAVKNGDLKEVSDAKDETDLNGMKLVVTLKRGSNPRDVLKKLNRLTPLRSSVSFNTQLIVDNRCKAMGLLELLNEWISFRVECLNRVYTFKRDKASREEHILSTWEKIYDHIKEVVALIADSKDTDNDDIVCQKLMQTYGLDEAQANYLLDLKIRAISKANASKKLNELTSKRKDIADYTTVIESDNEKYKIIVADMDRIIKTYEHKNRTNKADPIIPQPKEEKVEKVDDSTVNVILTKSGFLKRLTSIRDITNYELPEGEEEAARWAVKNNQHILVFTYDGTVYKIAVNDIDAGKGPLKDEVYKLIGLPNSHNIMLIDPAGDYTKHFNLVYPNGRGTRVYYSQASGNRKKYKSLFEECQPGMAWYTFADEFFMITKRKKAAYCDLTTMGMLTRRVAFKVARVNHGDVISELLPVSQIPDMNLIDIDKYYKGYTVCINSDPFYELPAQESEDDTSGTTEVDQETTAETSENQ